MLSRSFAGLVRPLAVALALVTVAGSSLAAQPNKGAASAQPPEKPPSQSAPTAAQAQPAAPTSPGQAPAPPEAPQASPEPRPLILPTPPPLAIPPIPISPEQVTARAIEDAALQPDVPLDQQPALLVKVEVLLDRAHNSPGAIDGRNGKNLDHALGIYEHQHRLQAGVTSTVVASLEKTQGGAGSIAQTYTITDKDEVGPFIGHLPSDFYAQSKLHHMGYTSAEEELAERFHMSQRLLEAMNPGVDFSKVGTTITIVRPHSGGLGAQVAKIEVDKTDDEVMAYGADGRLIASFPSTIGSADHPAPSGDYTVADIRPDPVYVYDPRVLHWGPRRHGRFTIKRGPNNPTGVIWIGLSKPTYGIHGTPNADLIGKTASHGCVRLTNWDAWDLGNSVKPGAAVAFTGHGPRKAAPQAPTGDKAKGPENSPPPRPTPPENQTQPT